MTILIGRGDISLSRYVTTTKAKWITCTKNMADESGTNMQPELLISRRGATGGVSQQAEHKGIYMEILWVHT